MGAGAAPASFATAGSPAIETGSSPVPEAPPLDTTPPPDPTTDSTQIQFEGQSESTLQLVALAWQYPGNEVSTLHSGAVGVPASRGRDGGVGSGTSTPPLAPPTPEPAEPVAVLVPVLPATPEQAVVTFGWQTKPAPQSASALQGSCHLKMHCETVVSSHLGGGGGGTGSQVVAPGSHFTGAEPLAEQDVKELLRQTMSCPQSASLWQDAS